MKKFKTKTGIELSILEENVRCDSQSAFESFHNKNNFSAVKNRKISKAHNDKSKKSINWSWNSLEKLLRDIYKEE